SVTLRRFVLFGLWLAATIPNAYRIPLQQSLPWHDENMTVNLAVNRDWLVGGTAFMLANIMKFLLGAAVATALLGAPAWAHRTSIGSTSGISIPSLTHGQMAVIAQYRREILALADGQIARSDDTFFRLRNYVDLQYLYCAWGLVPGSVTDEASPFNECSHAYLSGVRALLLYMRTMPGDQSAVHALVDR